MLFGSMDAVIAVFSLLSSLSETDVKCFFERTLTGRMHGISEVIVESGKELCSVYKRRPGNFCITFHYGVWNTAGFPQQLLTLHESGQ